MDSQSKLLTCPLITHLSDPWRPSGGSRDAKWQAEHQVPAVVPPDPPGASGVGPQWEPARGAGTEDHSHRDHGDWGRVWCEELALPDLPGPLVLLQLLHTLSQQVHSDAVGGGTQYARWGEMIINMCRRNLKHLLLFWTCCNYSVCSLYNTQKTILDPYLPARYKTL